MQINQLRASNKVTNNLFKQFSSIFIKRYIIMKLSTFLALGAVGVNPKRTEGKSVVDKISQLQKQDSC